MPSDQTAPDGSSSKRAHKDPINRSPARSATWPRTSTDNTNDGRLLQNSSGNRIGRSSPVFIGHTKRIMGVHPIPLGRSAVLGTFWRTRLFSAAVSLLLFDNGESAVMDRYHLRGTPVYRRAVRNQGSLYNRLERPVNSTTQNCNVSCHAISLMLCRVNASYQNFRASVQYRACV